MSEAPVSGSPSFAVDRVRPAYQQVAEQLMAHDALDAHLRDELGITPAQRAQPVQAAMASAASFAVGAGLPLAATLVAPASYISTCITAFSLMVLTALGTIAARAGGANAMTGSRQRESCRRRSGSAGAPPGRRCGYWPRAT